MSESEYIRTSPVKDCYFKICDDQDQIIRDMINSSQSTCDPSTQEDTPTEISIHDIDKLTKDDNPNIASLNDTITLIENKYGKDWKEHILCKLVVIWASKMFKCEHVKEIVPDLFDLCEEYRNTGKVNGKQLPEDFFLLVCNILNPETECIKYEKIN